MTRSGSHLKVTVPQRRALQLEMRGFCAGPACGSWAPRQRPSPPALLQPATPKRAPVLPMLSARRSREPIFRPELVTSRGTFSLFSQ